MPLRLAGLTCLLAGCAVSIGVRPAGPGLFMVSERRAPVLGGAAAAQRAVLSEATTFCQAQGGVFAPVSQGAVGSPYAHYGPTGYVATFRCAPPVP